MSLAAKYFVALVSMGSTKIRAEEPKKTSSCSVLNDSWEKRRTKLKVGFKK